MSKTIGYRKTQKKTRCASCAPLLVDNSILFEKSDSHCAATARRNEGRTEDRLKNISQADYR